jgi:hypothetical protein
VLVHTAADGEDIVNSCVRSAGTYQEPLKLGVRSVERVIADR